jgi:hypothetical protein
MNSLKEAVHHFNTDWMTSKVGAEERFGIWMLCWVWDLPALTPCQKESVHIHSGDKSATYCHILEMAHLWISRIL